MENRRGPPRLGGQGGQGGQQRDRARRQPGHRRHGARRGDHHAAAQRHPARRPDPLGQLHDRHRQRLGLPLGIGAQPGRTRQGDQLRAQYPEREARRLLCQDSDRRARPARRRRGACRRCHAGCAAAGAASAGGTGVRSTDIRSTGVRGTGECRAGADQRRRAGQDRGAAAAMTSLRDRAGPADRPGERERLLREIGAAASDGPLPLAEAALALAVREQPAADPLVYHRHLAALAEDIGRAAAPARTLGERIAACNDILFGKYAYQGDTITYDDLQNANLMRVIDRRRGLPVALGILYIHGGRAQGWQMAGLAFPGHFLVRLEQGGERAIIDPFNLGTRRSPADLREMLKATAGIAAELEPAHYAPVGDRQVLLRLQNNIKLRLVQGEQLDKALAVVGDMLLLPPHHAALWDEGGLLPAHLDNYRAAIAALEEFLPRASGDT